MLMERYGLSADHAMSYLRRNSQHANVKVRDLAEALVAERDARPGDQRPRCDTRHTPATSVAPA